MFAHHLPTLGVGSTLHLHIISACRSMAHGDAIARQGCCAQLAHRLSPHARPPIMHAAHKHVHMPSLDMHGIHMLHTITRRAAWHEHCMGHARSASPAAFAPPCLASLHTRREPLHTSQHTRPLAKPRTPFLLFPFRPRAESDPKVNLESEKLKRPNPESRTENSHRDTQPKPRATRRDPMVCNTVQLSDCLSPDPKCPHRVTCG